MKKWRFFLGALLLGVAAFLVACGGGSSEEETRDVDLNPIQQATAMGGTMTLDNFALSKGVLVLKIAPKKMASAPRAAAAVSATVTPDEFYVWAEALLPTAFPKGPTSILHSSGAFTYRSYSTGFYLAVRADGAVYVLSPAPESKLQQFGFLSDYTCAVKPTACGAPVTIAGTIKVEVASHTVTPTLIGGKISGVSTGTIDPAQVTEICAESLVLGFATNTKACGPYVGGKAVISNVTNNDRVQYTIRTTTPGQYVWLGLDPSEATYWRCEGLGCKYSGPASPGFVEYAEGGVGYRKPHISVTPGKLVLSFGRNKLAGFGLEGVPTDFYGEHFEFVFRSTSPVTKAYHTWNDVTKEFQVVFEGATLKCTDTGNITVHRQILGYPPEHVFYSDVPAGWLSVATPPNQPDLIWGFDAGVTPVVHPAGQPSFVGFTYKLPGC